MINDKSLEYLKKIKLKHTKVENVKHDELQLQASSLQSLCLQPGKDCWMLGQTIRIDIHTQR